MMAAKEKGINPALEKAIGDLLTQTMKDPQATLTDKMKVIDRALHLEKVKLKISDDDWGRGFQNPDDEGEN